MTAKVVKVDPLKPNQDYLSEAADILAKGGLVIIPTETVYGIAANLRDKQAIARLYDIKQRPQDKPFSLHIDEKEAVEDFAVEIPVGAYKLISRFWPGPLTLVLKSKDNATVGIRMPDDAVALRVIALSGVPVVCPSANLSGNPAPRTFQEAIKDLGERVDFAVDAGDTRLGVESSVVDLTAHQARILREGAIKKADIEKALNKKTVLFVCTGNSCRSVMAKALLEDKLRRLNRQDTEVFSAGTMMLSGLGATEETKNLLKGEGLDVSGHHSQTISREMINKSDIILVMEKRHEESVLQLAPHSKNKLFLLKEFAKIDGASLDIEDPIGRSPEFYQETFGIIKEAIERIIRII